VEQLRKASELEPRNAQHLLWLGTALERSGNPGEAVEAWKAAAAADPRLAEPYERLAQLHAGQGRCDLAAPQLEKALALSPAQQRLRVQLGDCREKLGKHGEAIRLYREALRADPKLTGLHYKIARAYHESSGIKDALPWYEQATRHDPSNPMPHYYLGFSQKERGQAAKAVASFKAYLAAKPDAEDRRDIEREIEDLGGQP
jgi:tetratricopeptide (TPR) repeat protein